KETRLLHIAIPSINAEEIESYRRPQNQGVFRTLQVLLFLTKHSCLSSQTKLRIKQKTPGAFLCRVP
ncbi:hypothetical protein, partial [Acetobacter syzygii]|uniref:hypothetical protein n=1 Tax=Acetobacter syzygii TaxID=146476 RepID=UPI0039ED87E7